LYLATYTYLNGKLGADQWLAATPESVFLKHQYWRAWTTLFVHGDAGHLGSNLFLFAPLCYWLTGYFDLLFFPVAGFVIGGLVNLLVLKTMPAQATLIGVSGVVYWMGAAALTLFLLVDRRHSLKRRFSTALFLFLMLFVPDTYMPQVSYSSHLFGFLAGVPSAALLYAWRRKDFEKAEVKEIIFDEPTTVAVADEPQDLDDVELPPPRERYWN